jgi:hypothetical protein
MVMVDIIAILDLLLVVCCCYSYYSFHDAAYDYHCNILLTTIQTII